MLITGRIKTKALIATTITGLILLIRQNTIAAFIIGGIFLLAGVVISLLLTIDEVTVPGKRDSDDLFSENRKKDDDPFSENSIEDGDLFSENSIKDDDPFSENSIEIDDLSFENSVETDDHKTEEAENTCDSPEMFMMDISDEDMRDLGKMLEWAKEYCDLMKRKRL